MKRLVLLLFTISFILPGFSQNDKKTYFKDFGLIFGLGVGSITGSPSWKTGYGVIAGVDSKIYSFNETCSIIGGIGFEFQNVPWEENSDGYSYSGNSTFANVIFPVLYHHDFNNKISVEGGIQPKIRLSAKDKEDGQSYNEKDNYNVVNAAVVAGILAKITDNLSAGIRAALDMFNMDSSDGMYYYKNSPDRSLFVTGVLRFSFGSSEPPPLPAPPPPPAPAPPSPPPY